MDSRIRTTLILVVLMFIGTTGLAQDDAVDVTFGWAASPNEDVDGNQCLAAVMYEVYVQRGGEDIVKVAEVESDTTYTLAAERGVVQRVRVIGYDILGRPSEPSEWSDPIYFEIERGPESPFGPPPSVATLRRNFPNPFNPETTIAYGVPEGTAADTRLALEIFNLRGERIRRFSLEATPGWHTVTWDGCDDGGLPQATGTYISRYACGKNVQVSKMVMVK